MKIQFPFKEHGLFRYMNTVFLTGILIFLLGDRIGVTDVGMKQVLVAMAVTGLIIVFHELLSQRFIWGLFAGVLLFALTVGFVGVDVSREFVLSYMKWLLDIPGWNREWIVYFGIAQICWLVLVCYLFQFVQEKEFRIKPVVITGIAGLLVYLMITGKDVSYAGTGLGIAYILFVLTEWTQRKWIKVKTQSIAAYMNWFLPVMLVYFVILMSMPVSEKPYDWALVKKAQEWIKEEVLLFSQELFEKEDMEFSFSNFSDEGDMGDSLFTDEKKVMVVRSKISLKTDIYLTGKIFDTFDGRAWTVQKQEYPKAMFLDTVSLLSAVRNYDNAYSADYIRSGELEICYRYLKSDYVFVPIKSWDIEKDGENAVLKEENGSLLFGKKQDYGTTFYTDFYQMNTDSEFFEEMPQQEHDPDRIKTLLLDLKASSGVDVSVQEFEEYENYCGSYLGDEIVLSDTLQRYLEDILKDADTDVEKLRALEAELASFTYTKEPARIPDNITDAASYLEYFLLESREGYCSHFATAFTLLARSQGIPARYVHGYSVPMQGQKEVVVTSVMAHAWPEAYIDNVGWIPFEPTPGYGIMRYGSWKTQKGNIIPVKSQKKYYERPEGTDVYAIEEYNVLDSESADAFGKEELIRILGRIGLTLLVIMCGIVLFTAEEHLRTRYLLSRMDGNGIYLFEVKKNLKLLSCLKFDRKETETVSEYRSRILPELSGNMQLQFMEGYESILYGNKEANAEIWKVLLEEQRGLLGILKEKSRFRYYVYKFFGR